VIDCGHSDGWQPLTRPQMPTSGLAPGVRGGQWEVVGQAPQRQQAGLAAMVQQAKISLTEGGAEWLLGHARQYKKYLQQ
jgi:hypothetical protein